MGGQNVIASLVAMVVLFACAALFWFAQVDGTARPAVKAANAPAAEFSAVRADAVLKRILGPERPHPVSTAENAAVRARIIEELAALGIPATVHPAFGCNEERMAGAIACASVNDILGEVKPGKGKAILLMAHYDSVPAGPGASDDESGVATVIETARALNAAGLAGKHPILALLTDGEEAGLLGAAAFLHDPALRARVGAVVNVEARGNRGRSLLFQTSSGDGPLIDLYAANVPDYATSSAFAEIYRLLPNDTDLTPFIRAGFPSVNFAFSENVAHYHTALDTRAHLDPRTLQQHGDNLLGVARGLETADFAVLRGQDEIYVDLLGRALPRLSAKWVLPLSLEALILILVAALMADGEALGWRRWCAGFAITPGLLLGAGAMGWLLHAVAAHVSGMPDPSYAYPTIFRAALALGIAFATLVASRVAPARAATACVWIWIGGLGVAAALFVPGLTPYFLIPAVLAGALLLLAALLPGGWDGPVGQGALLIAALPLLLLWVGFGAMGETVMGLKLHPLFTLPIAFGMTALVPLFATYSLPRGAWLAACGAIFVAAVAAAVYAGGQPAYSAIAPQRLSISYVQQENRALWAVDALSPVPASMRSVAKFSPMPEKVSPFAWSSSYVAPAEDLHAPLPDVRILSVRHDAGLRRVALMLHGSDSANQMVLVLSKPAALKAIDIRDWHFEAPPQWAKLDRVVLACMSRDCASLPLTLTVAGDAPLDAVLGENRFGLPAQGARLLAARPRQAVPSQNGDGMVLIRHLSIPPT